MNQTASPSGYPCPYCHSKKLETMATAPYVRGLIAAYLIGSKTYIGCIPCVRGKLRAEAGLSLLIGWFSIVSLFLNPFMILYNLGQSFFVGAKPEAVARRLRELGLPDGPQTISLNSIGYALAASMILADGKVEEAELVAAEKAGDRVFGDFDEAALRMLVEDGRQLPPVEDLASMLRDSMSNEDKEKVMVYLSEIAMADGEVSDEERQMLQRVGTALGMLETASA